MKRIILMCLLALIAMAGFTQNKKALVIFFSRAGENWQVGVVSRGNTAVMVDYLTELADVDTFQIVPVVPYPESYQECINYATNEVNTNARPTIKYAIDNITGYDHIFIGGPIWWGRPPMIFRTFFEAHPELDGKTIIPFGTHGGSGVGSYASLIREYYPNATLLESLGIAGTDIRNTASRTLVANWLKRIKLDRETTGIFGIRKEGRKENQTEYLLSGIRSVGGRGIVIKGGKKYLSSSSQTQ